MAPTLQLATTSMLPLQHSEVPALPMFHDMLHEGDEVKPTHTGLYIQLEPSVTASAIPTERAEEKRDAVSIDPSNNVYQDFKSMAATGRTMSDNEKREELKPTATANYVEVDTPITASMIPTERAEAKRDMMTMFSKWIATTAPVSQSTHTIDMILNAETSSSSSSTPTQSKRAVDAEATTYAQGAPHFAFWSSTGAPPGATKRAVDAEATTYSGGAPHFAFWTSTGAPPGATKLSDADQKRVDRYMELIEERKYLLERKSRASALAKATGVDTGDFANVEMPHDFDHDMAHDAMNVEADEEEDEEEPETDDEEDEEDEAPVMVKAKAVKRSVLATSDGAKSTKSAGAMAVMAMMLVSCVAAYL